MSCLERMSRDNLMHIQ